MKVGICEEHKGLSFFLDDNNVCPGCAARKEDAARINGGTLRCVTTGRIRSNAPSHEEVATGSVNERFKATRTLSGFDFQMEEEQALIKAKEDD